MLTAIFRRRSPRPGTGAAHSADANSPRRLLVAAHIKPRSQCSDTERIDFDNIGMLACLLGYESLYEHGYITTFLPAMGAALPTERR